MKGDLALRNLYHHHRPLPLSQSLQRTGKRLVVVCARLRVYGLRGQGGRKGRSGAGGPEQPLALLTGEPQLFTRTVSPGP